MPDSITYRARCHCGAVRFRFRSDPITEGIRCNCSICIRKGAVMSVRYYPPDAFDPIEGTESLTLYQFGDQDVGHYFCKTCGVYPFHLVVSVPADYTGPAKPGDRRVNVGCIDEIDALTLPIRVVDGRSF